MRPLLLSAKKEKVQMFIAFCFFVCTTGVVSSHTYLVCFLLVCVVAHFPNMKMDLSFGIVFLIIILSTINEITAILFRDDIEIHSVMEFIPYSIMVFFTMYTAKVIDERVFKWLVVFIIIDIGVGILQKFIGVNSFFPDAVREEDGLLLYDMTVTGLNNNTSGFGEKIFLGLLLYEKYPFCQVIKKRYFYSLVLIGLVLCFSRTAFVTIIAYFTLKAIVQKKTYVIVICVATLVLVVLSIDGLSDIVFKQFFRGNDSFDTANANLASERDVVYPYYWNYFVENFWTGNGSFKYYVDVFKDGRLFHAHNSYLQTLANNGAVISFLYFYLTAINIRKSNLIYILPILVFALFQTFIWWGLSFADMIMYHFLLIKNIR